MVIQRARAAHDLGGADGPTSFGIFNYATRALGGAVTVKRFDLTTP